MNDSRPAKRPLFEVCIEWPAIILTAVMILHITANALMRTYFNQPLPNTLEYVQYWYMPIVAFLGFLAAQYRNQHIAADLLYQSFPDRVKRVVLAAVLILSTAVMFALAWFGFQEASHAVSIRRTAGISGVPAWPVYILIPITFGILTVQFALSALQVITRGLPAEPEAHLPAAIAVTDQEHTKS